MAVGMIDALNGRSRHQERLEDPVLHPHQGPRLHAFVVVRIRSVEIDRLDIFPRWVESDRKKIGKHGRADRLRERLTLCFVLLAMAFYPMAENLMEEDTRGSAGKNRRSHEWLRRRSAQQLRQIRTH